MPLGRFHPIVATWFAERFGRPTEAQALGWPHILDGADTLVMAPTGSGKTLTAFLAGLDRLVREGVEGRLADGVRIVYVSPLKALGADVERNLVRPLAEIEAAAHRQGRLLPPIRTALRTGDTTPAERARILRRPPHVLITTPESLYLLLTSRGGRAILGGVEAVIVDEIHAMVGQKRGAHLALTLERLDARLAEEGRTRPQRIGLSATVEPPEEAARFLAGFDDEGRPRPVVTVDAGRARHLDLAIEVPKETLSTVASLDAWADVYRRLVELIRAHRSTLVFVPSRRLAERVAHHLEEIFAPPPDDEEAPPRPPDRQPTFVAAHHGALSKETRQSVERRLAAGQLKAVVATASLELGIDVGEVDLVCQLGSPRALSVLRQRIGRACHAVGGTPKGRLFALTRDDLVELGAAVRALRRGRIDRSPSLPAPLDILAQQLVATAATGDWREDDLYRLVRRAAPYAALERERFDDVAAMLSDGITTRRGRAGAHLLRDRVNGKLKARRGARLLALTSGGAIPEKADYQVVEDATEQMVGTLDEDFAIESMAGDIFLLGSTSWRVRRIETGRVRVEAAPGQPPTIPFWNGEGLARTEELSEETAALREEIFARAERDGREATAAWLRETTAMDEAGALQAVDYVTEGARALGAVPTQRCVVAERFFDDSGGMQLVVHAPFGARINRAWGLGLRKKFCRTFDFELQAAATDDAVLLSLGPQHSFPLDAIFGFLSPATLRETLEQAALQAPMWEARWRWNATRALAVPRQIGGRRTPPYLLRMRAADLLAAVFPAAAGCQDNHGLADRPLPEHPLVDETARDCLDEAMDAAGLARILEGMREGRIAALARDTVAPSPFAHAILNANPYAFLDDAPLEERRTRAVSTTRPGELSLRPDDLTRLDPAAVAQVVAEAQPEPGDPDELHDLLCSVGLLAPRPAWRGLYDALVAEGRAATLTHAGGERWVAAERSDAMRLLFPEAPLAPPLVAPPGVPAYDAGQAALLLVAGALESAGPLRAAEVAAHLVLDEPTVEAALAQLELEGRVVQGRFGLSGVPEAIEWCDRRLLQRIHRLTLGRRRAEVRPVPPATLMRFLFRWQHVAEGTRLAGPDGVLAVIGQLEGLELPAAAWEREVLPARVEGYRPEWLDELCLAGEVAWGRLRPAPPETLAEEARRPRPSGRVALYRRLAGAWLLAPPPGSAPLPPPSDWPGLTPLARRVTETLAAGGAAFAADLAAALAQPVAAVEDALWELVLAGVATSDGFAGLRALVSPDARTGRGRRGEPLGRWSLLRRERPDASGDGNSYALDAEARDAYHLAWAELLLSRYGVVLRALLGRETAAPAWRDLLAAFRRLEARGVVRGGRFVTGHTGEQFARPAAAEALAALRAPARPEELAVAATDPLNLVGLVVGSSRVAAIAGHLVQFRDGEPTEALRRIA